jgi:cyclic AMP-dependent transcription factor ATF-2
MDSSSARFLDYLAFDDPDPYQSPQQEDEDGAIHLNPFSPYNVKQELGGPQTLADPRDAVPRADVWDGLSGQVEPMGTADQTQLFVDPELYSPDSGDDETKAQIQVIPMGMSQPSTRRPSRSTKSPSRRTSKSGSISTTDITPPEMEPPRKRKTRRTKRQSSTVEEDRRRRKFLERNRIAASKCREKKKQYVSELEETKIELETQHTQLQMEASALIAEISTLKHRLMAHAKCNDGNIDRWLNNEARRFVQTNNELFGQPFLAFPPNPQDGLSTGSPRSRNASIASTYSALQGVGFEGLGSGERQGSIAFSHGEPNLPEMLGPNLMCHPIVSEPLYPSPTDATFPLLSPALKREPDMNFNPMPDPMFSPAQSAFGGG